jgi:hypothetical protein
MFVFSGNIFMEETAPIPRWLVEAGRRGTLIVESSLTPVVSEFEIIAYRIGYQNR